MPHPGKGDEISITSTRKAQQAAGQYHYRTRDTWSLSRMKILSCYEQTRVAWLPGKKHGHSYDTLNFLLVRP